MLRKVTIAGNLSVSGGISPPANQSRATGGNKKYDDKYHESVP
jgi:hypothetical protein